MQMDLLSLAPEYFILHFSRQAAFYSLLSLRAFRGNFRPEEPQPSIRNTLLSTVLAATSEQIKIKTSYLLSVY